MTNEALVYLNYVTLSFQWSPNHAEKTAALISNDFPVSHFALQLHTISCFQVSSEDKNLPPPVFVFTNNAFGKQLL